LPEQQKNPRQPPFAEIEELIDQVFLDSNNPGKQIFNKQRRELRVSLERANRALLSQSNDIGGANRSRCTNPQRLPAQAAFAKKAASLQEGDDSFFCDAWKPP
jgi:hypothetical protein